MSSYNLVVLVSSMEVFAFSISELMNFSLPWVPGGGVIAVFSMILIWRLFKRNSDSK
ncbi:MULTISPECIES: hypothetical protein [unclassified Prochlorococcus]|uniref:hypothetical protein n=1 Tax=unclassified Prochlorococcus TaxID=2627481 RepID=UPI00053372F5|nr:MULTISPECIES: hypothetical protein [unclassified Prochlorococcus]KGG24377.1 hypothetical protein EV12_3022 [Prochlorococcus sp. MIT 0701]KGG25718.1 hypothetical protein EV13_3051 [Prochlorococcus sp. MIT 0702]KGG31985.1 hypothetical protein EV14_2110 [Prochlorococcus sp. MIT 0703]